MGKGASPHSSITPDPSSCHRFIILLGFSELHTVDPSSCRPLQRCPPPRLPPARGPLGEARHSVSPRCPCDLAASSGTSLPVVSAALKLGSYAGTIGPLSKQTAQRQNRVCVCVCVVIFASPLLLNLLMRGSQTHWFLPPNYPFHAFCTGCHSPQFWVLSEEALLLANLKDKGIQQ